MKENGIDAVHIRVVRDGFVSPLTPEQQRHPSETALDNVAPDAIIHNAGTLDDLRRVVMDWLECWGYGYQMTIDDLVGVAV